MLATVTHRLSFIFLGFVFVPLLQAEIFLHHPPYQDQHFNLDSTRLTNLGGYSTGIDGSINGFGNGCIACMNGSNGSRGHVCPPVQNAILKLWVPDGTQVEVNGYATKPQTLGGIHRNSRVLSLEGLTQNRVSPCEIVVIACDELGNAMRYRCGLSVQAGGHYEVRYPQDFEPMQMPFAAPMVETVEMGATDYPGHEVVMPSAVNPFANDVTKESIKPPAGLPAPVSHADL